MARKPREELEEELAQLPAKRRTSLEGLSDSEIVSVGRRKVLELCIDALDTAEVHMSGINAAAAVSAARLVLDMALKGPFQLEQITDNLEGERLEARAREAIAEVLKIAAQQSGENNAD